MYFEITNKIQLSQKLASVQELKNKIGTTQLIVSPGLIFWIAEYILEGAPNKLLLFPFQRSAPINIKKVRELLDDNKLFLGLPCEEGTVLLTNNKTQKKTILHPKIANIKETISTIPVADQFDDYRPCRPPDFIGRRALQKEIWDFLEE